MGSLAKKDLHLTSSSFYHRDHGDSSSPNSDQGSYGYEEENRLMEKNVAAPPDIIVNNHSAFHDGSVASTDVGIRPHHHLSLINFKRNETTDCFGHATGAGSLLSFQQEPKSMDSLMWKDDDATFGNNAYNLRKVISKNDLNSASSESHLIDEINKYQPPSNSYGWLYSDSTVVTADRVQETRAHEESSSALLKRPYVFQEDHQSMASSKKQCAGSGSGSSSAKNSKSKPTSSIKDHPQSLAAKNRRERISERLKVLQELVPNGSKVDLVTMLEKAISYVKFLQLQVKVLAADEFWPAHGGKAPDISQVKEAIDAILASEKEKSSSSK